MTSSPHTPVDEGKLGGENDRQFLNSLVTKPTDAWTKGEMNRLAWMALAMQERLAPSATTFIEPEWKMDSAPLHWPYAEREAWKGGYYEAMKAFQKAQSGQ